MTQQTATADIWGRVLGHDRQIEQFRRSIRQERLAHGYLFVGPAGIGKRLFADTLAQCLLCQERADGELDACGTCPSCKSVMAGTHPDLVAVACPPGKREIPVETFIGTRERRGKEGLCFELSLRPSAADRKIAIIDGADVMHEAAANALLKTLEEPPADALLFLIAAQFDEVLPTIRSRTQVLRFAPLTDDVLVQLLRREDPSLSEEEAHGISRLAEGSLHTAARLRDPEIRELRDELFASLTNRHATGSRIAAELLKRIEKSAKDSAAQRELASWALRLTVENLRHGLAHLPGDAGGDRPAAKPPRFLVSTDSVDAVARVIDRAAEAEAHIHQNVSLALALEGFYQELVALRPNWLR